MRILRAALALVAAGCGTAGASPPAWRHTVLVELFTSQGCSSCPAADELVAELPRLGLGRDKVVPLTFHVEYWDELGWKDPFASTAFTERQGRYGRSGALRSPDGDGRPPGLYTPQMVLDGRVHFSGARRDLALAEMRRVGAEGGRLTLTGRARVDGETAAVSVTAAPHEGWAGGDEWRLWVAVARRAARTAVLRGENAGRQLEEAAIVRGLSGPVPVPLAGGTVEVKVRRPADLRWDDAELAVFVQSERTLEVAGAVSLLLSR
jgi:hypothetical protein